MSSKPVIALTMGDPAGVGPEICLRAAGDADVLARCTPVLMGDAGIFREVARRLQHQCPARVVSLQDLSAGQRPEEPAICPVSALPVADIQPGRVQKVCGQASFQYIETAIRLAMGGRVAAVVTAPINKEALSLAGIGYPGHTEIFADLTQTPRSCMLLADDAISCSFVTTHTAYTKAPAAISTQRVLDVIELTAAAMTRMRGRPPRIVVCGLNPHAGEHGLFGDEEGRCIEPAIAAARDKGLTVEGPLPPDAAFIPQVRARTDLYICMYHDQGHIPFKMLAFDTGVNITLGLSIVRTSVDHGTAFDIAWQGKASPSSMKQAIRYGVMLGGTGR